MAVIKWALGDFLTGEILQYPLQGVLQGNEEISVDIHGEDTADIEISLDEVIGYPRSEFWREDFALVNKFIAAVDDEKYQQNKSDSILFAGFINKRSIDLKRKTLRIQGVGMMEYLKSRVAIYNDYTQTHIEDPEAAMTLRSGSWRGVAGKVVSEAFDWARYNGVIPPMTLGTVPTSSGDVRAIKILASDGLSYFDVLEKIRTEMPGRGQETRFSPRLMKTPNNDGRVFWDVKIGTSTTPHIGSDLEWSIPLRSNGQFKFSDFSISEDSSSLFTSLWTQSRAGDPETHSGMDLRETPLQNYGKILLDRFETFSTELTVEEMNEQIGPRMAEGMDPDRDTSVVLEEEEPQFWLDRLGSLVNIQGDADSGTTGYDYRLRVVGVNFSASTGTVSLDLMKLQTVYPRLPRKKERDALVDKAKKKPISDSLKKKKIADGTWKFPTTGGGTDPDGGGGDPGNPGDDDGTSPQPYGVSWGTGGTVAERDARWYEQTSRTVSVTSSYLDSLANVNYLGQVGNTILLGIRDISHSVDFSAASGFTGFPIIPFSGLDVYSGYFNNGSVINFAIRETIDGSSLANMCASRINQLISRPSSYYDASAGKHAHYYVTQAMLSTRDIFSVQGYVFIAMGATVQWQAFFEGETTTPRETITETQTIFLKAAIRTFDTIDAFVPDYLSSVANFSAAQNTFTRWGDWVYVNAGNGGSGGYSNMVLAAPVNSSGRIGDWVPFPVAPFDLQFSPIVIAANPQGNGMAAYGQYGWTIPIEDGKATPAQGAVWTQIPGASRVFQAQEGRVYGLSGSASSQGNSLVTVDLTGTSFTNVTSETTLYQPYFGWDKNFFSCNEYLYLFSIQENEKTYAAVRIHALPTSA